MKNLNELAKEIHQNNVEKGFFDAPKNIGEMLMLTVSELSEALEADRKNKYADVEGFGLYLSHSNNNDTIFYQLFENEIKNTFQDEIADTIIRLLDIAAFKGIDIEWHIQQKMRYNKLRPYKHGKKY